MKLHLVTTGVKNQDILHGLVDENDNLIGLIRDESIAKIIIDAFNSYIPPEKSPMKGACYECTHYEHIPGDAHIACKHPLASPMYLIDIRQNPLAIVGDPYGKKQGWFLWPLNFDPVWLLNCNGFDQKKEK